MNRWLVFLVFCVVFFISQAFSGGNIGVSCGSVNGNYYIVSSSSFASVLLGIGLALFITFFPRQRFKEDNNRIVGIWRRFGAFFIDCTAIAISLLPILTLPVLIAESLYVGSYDWSFQREFVMASDIWLAMSAVIIMFFFLFYYFYKHLIMGKQTIGQYILCFHVVGRKESEIAKSQACQRLILSFISFFIWPISCIMALRNPSKFFWHDNKTRTYPIRVNYNNKS